MKTEDLMTAYVNFVLTECHDEDDENPALLLAWRQAVDWKDWRILPLLAEAIILQHDMNADRSFRVNREERGENADERLCQVADELGI